MGLFLNNSNCDILSKPINLEVFADLMQCSHVACVFERNTSQFIFSSLGFPSRITDNWRRVYLILRAMVISTLAPLN